MPEKRSSDDVFPECTACGAVGTEPLTEKNLRDLDRERRISEAEPVVLCPLCAGKFQRSSSCRA